MIEFRNIHSTVKLVLDCNVKHYQDIPENIIKIIDGVCNSNNYFWKITQHKYVNVPVIPASLLNENERLKQQLEEIKTAWVDYQMVKDDDPDFHKYVDCVIFGSQEVKNEK